MKGTSWGRFIVTGVLLLLASERAVAAVKPNMVVFLADDMQLHLPGFNGGIASTPNLDRLAAGGATLSQFYVHSVCSPTRAAFLTGRYPFRNGMEMSIRQGAYKLVGKELYDIEADPGEKQNIAAAHPEIYQRLQQRIMDLVKERRKPEPHSNISKQIDMPLLVFGEKENAHPPGRLKPYIDQLSPGKKELKRGKKTAPADE